MSKGPDNSAGRFVRWELMTHSCDGAKSFYMRLGATRRWETSDEELSDGAIYTHLHNGVQRLGGIHAMPAGLAARRVSAHWTPYVAVADVESALLSAKRLGAKVTAESFDFAQLGRMALIQDPGGAPLGLWQAAVPEPAAIAWHELSTHDAAAAAAFYEALFGWRHSHDGGGGLNLQVFTKGSEPVAALLALGTRFQAVPAHWLPYFFVEDMASAVAAVTGGGGRLLAAPVSHALGIQAVAQDPQGAVFGIMAAAQGHGAPNAGALPH